MIDLCDQSRAILPSEGYLLSPSYPLPYPKSLDCVRQLKPSDSDAYIFVHVLHIDVSNRLTSDTCYDKLVLREGDSVLKYHELCSYQDWTGEEYVFSELNAEFKSDGVPSEHAGFLIYYQGNNVLFA